MLIEQLMNLLVAATNLLAPWGKVSKRAADLVFDLLAEANMDRFLAVYQGRFNQESNAKLIGVLRQIQKFLDEDSGQASVAKAKKVCDLMLKELTDVVGK